MWLLIIVLATHTAVVATAWTVADRRAAARQRTAEALTRELHRAIREVRTPRADTADTPPPGERYYLGPTPPADPGRP